MGIENHSLTLCSSNSGPNTSTKKQRRRQRKARIRLLISLIYGAKNLAEFQIRRFDGAVRCAECKVEQDPTQAWGRTHGMLCRTGHVLDVIAQLEEIYQNQNGSPTLPAPTLVGASAAGGPFRFAVAEGALCECEAECGGRHGVEGCGRRGAAEYIVAGFKQRLCAGCAENALRYCQAQGLGFVDHTPAPIGGAA